MLLTQLNDWSSTIGRSFIYLLVIIAIMAFAYYLTRFLGSKVRGFSGGNLKIMEGVSVGQGSSVMLLKAGKRIILLGVTKERVTLLTEMNEADLISAEARAPGRFDTYLLSFLKGKKNDRQDS